MESNNSSCTPMKYVVCGVILPDDFMNFLISKLMDSCHEFYDNIRTAISRYLCAEFIVPKIGGCGLFRTTVTTESGEKKDVMIMGILMSANTVEAERCATRTDLIFYEINSVKEMEDYLNEHRHSVQQKVLELNRMYTLTREKMRMYPNYIGPGDIKVYEMTMREI